MKEFCKCGCGRFYYPLAERALAKFIPFREMTTERWTAYNFIVQLKNFQK